MTTIKIAVNKKIGAFSGNFDISTPLITNYIITKYIITKQLHKNLYLEIIIISAVTSIEIIKNGKNRPLSVSFQIGYN